MWCSKAFFTISAKASTGQSGGSFPDRKGYPRRISTQCPRRSAAQIVSHGARRASSSSIIGLPATQSRSGAPTAGPAPARPCTARSASTTAILTAVLRSSIGWLVSPSRGALKEKELRMSREGGHGLLQLCWKGSGRYVDSKAKLEEDAHVLLKEVPRRRYLAAVLYAHRTYLSLVKYKVVSWN